MQSLSPSLNGCRMWIFAFLYPQVKSMEPNMFGLMIKVAQTIKRFEFEDNS